MPTGAPTSVISPLSAVATLVTGRDSFGSLFGGPASSPQLPSREKLVSELIAANASISKVRTCQNFRYLHHSGDILEYKCLVRLLPAMIRLKLDAYCQQWKAQVVQHSEEGFVFRIKEASSFWQRCVGRQAGLEIQAQVRPLQRPDVQLSVATVRIQPFGGSDDEITQRLWEKGPVLFESLRSFLQPDPEHRVQERFAFAHPVRVYPVLSGRQLGERIEGKCKDISRGGVGFLVPQPLPTDKIYIHLHTAPTLTGMALLARIVRTHPLEGGWYEIGACFPSERAPFERIVKAGLAPGSQRLPFQPALRTLERLHIRCSKWYSRCWCRIWPVSSHRECGHVADTTPGHRPHRSPRVLFTEPTFHGCHLHSGNFFETLVIL